MEYTVYRPVRNSSSSQTVSKVLGLTLKEIAHRFNSPLTEEHSWAVCHLCSSKLLELQWPLPLGVCAEVSMDTIVVTTDGSVEFMKERGRIDTQDDMKTVLENLGVMVYSLLDYGLPDDQERTLSQPLENLIEMMTELDTNTQSIDDLDGSFSGVVGVCGSPTSLRTRDSGITEDNCGVWDLHLGRVIKACELHVIDLADPQEHFRSISRGMIEEAINIIKLDSDEDKQEPLSANPTGQQWEDVMEDIRQGVALKQVTTPPEADTKRVNVSEFELFLMSVAKFSKDKLNKVEFDKDGKPCGIHPQQLGYSITSDNLDDSFSSEIANITQNRVRRATVGDIHSSLMSELKTRPALKPASKRRLRPLSLLDRPLTPMESLLEEILTPPPLKKVERTSPKRLSMSLDCYRMCKSNPDLIDIPSPTTNFGYPSDPRMWSHDNRLHNRHRNISQSASSLTYDSSPQYVHSPTTPFSYTNPGPPPNFNHPHSQTIPVNFKPTFPSSKTKTKGSLFHKFVNKLSHNSPKDPPLKSILRKKRLSYQEYVESRHQVNFDPSQSDNYFNGRRATYVPTFSYPTQEYHVEDDVFLPSTPANDQRRSSLPTNALKPPKRPKQLAMHTPVPSYPNCTNSPVKVRSSVTRRDRVKSWAYCDDHSPPANVRSQRKSCGDVILEETGSQVFLWNIPENNVHPPPAHPPHTITASTPHNASPLTPNDIFLQLPQYCEPTNLEEFVHVRSTVTKAELYNLQLEDMKAFKNISEKKVCFSCRKTKFSLFSQSHLCYVCQRHVCSKCSKKHPLKGPGSLRKVAAIFKDIPHSMKSVVLCTPCLQHICPEWSKKSAKIKSQEQYDC